MALNIDNNILVFNTLQNILKAHRSPVQAVAQKMDDCSRRAELRWVKFPAALIILLRAESRSESESEPRISEGTKG